MKLTHCPSCSLVFTGPVAPGSRTLHRQPHILKCGHSFCGSCISQWLRKSGRSTDSDQAQVCCPLCKNVTAVENGLKDLPVNVYLSAYIGVTERAKMDQHLEVLEKLGSTLPRKTADKNEADLEHNKCKMCLTKDGSCKCVECDSVLCKICFEKVHKLSAAIRNHKPVPLTGPKVGQKLGESACTEHKRTIEYFCMDDSTSICSKCYIVGDHKGHVITSFEELNKQVLEDLEKEVETSKIVLGSLMKLDKKITDAMPNMKVDSKSLIEDVQKSFVQLHAVLQNREVELISSVTQAYKDFFSSLDDQRQNVEKSKVKLEDAFKNAQKLLKDAAMVIDGHAVLDVLKEARKTPCLLVKKESLNADSLTWEESNGADLLRAINEFGSICGTVESKYELKNIEEAPEQIEKVDTSGLLSSLSPSTLPSALSTSDKRENFHRPSSVDTGEDVIIESNTDDTSLLSKSSKSVASVTSDALKGSKFRAQCNQQEFIRTPVVKGEPQKVMVTHIRSPRDFFVQLIFNKRKFETLTHNINTWCRKEVSSKHVPAEVEKNMLVIARYSGDKVWYRARVLSTPTTTNGTENGVAKVQVLYIDFGNDEFVGLNDIRSMQARFMSYPEFAVHCSLFDIAPYEEDQPWSLQAIQEFLRLTQNKVFLQHTISQHNDVFETDLVCIPEADVFDDAFVSIRDVLVFLQVARFNTHSNSASRTSKPGSFSTVDFIPPTRLENGSTVQVHVTNVVSPWDFHVACEGCERDYYYNMMAEMHAIYNKDATNIYSLHYPRPNMVCSVKAADKKWYRAKVMESPKCREVAVYLVDTGAIKIVHHDNVKKLHRDFIKLPAQAIPCTLADVGTLNNDKNFCAKVQHWCQNVMTGGSGFARIVRWNKPTEIVLWLGKEISIQSTASVNYMLVEMGLARSTGLASVGVAQEYMANTVPGMDSNRMDQMDKARNVHLRSESIPATRNRASDSSSSNSTIMSVPHSSTVLSQQNAKFKKGRDGMQPKGKGASKQRKGKTSESKSQPLSKTKKSVTVKKRIQSEIEKALIASGEKPNPASVYLEVEVCNFVSPSEFYVRMQETEEEFLDLVDAIQAEYRNSSPPESPQWNVNDFCAVKIPEDGMWYRGNVKSIISDSNYEVEIVDYGFVWVIKPEDMRHLTYELGVRMDCAAVRCHLADLVPAGSVDVSKWSRTAIEFVSANLKDKKLHIRQEGQVTDLGLAVDVILQDMVGESAFEPAVCTYSSLRRAILEKGLAMPDKRPSLPSTPNTASTDPFKRIIFGKNTPLRTKAEKTETEMTEKRETMKESGSESGQFTTISANPEPKSPVQMREADSLSVPPYPLPSEGDCITVLPTYIDLVGTIYAQSVEWSDKLAHLSSELQRVYNYTRPDLTIAWKAPQLCVASFPVDNLWYRALITQIEDQQIQVRYIDYGNSAWVDVKCVREILPEFAAIHGLAYYCVLDGVEPNAEDGEWTVGVLEYMHGFCVDTECDITIKGVQDDCLLRVNLHKIKGLPYGIDLGEQLVTMGFAVNSSDMPSLYKQSQVIGQVLARENPYEPLFVGTVDDTFKAKLTHVELPNLIYLQRTILKDPDTSDFVKSGQIAEVNSSIREFEKMQEDLQTCKSLQLSALPDKGLMCLGQYSFDRQWYRAVVVESYPKSDSCLVVFVDYGTPEVVARAFLRLLPAEFWSFPAQGIRCYINILPPGGPHERWMKKSLTGVSNVLSGKELTVRILKDSPLVVELLEEVDGKFILAYEKLFDNRLALSPIDIDMWTMIDDYEAEDMELVKAKVGVQKFEEREMEKKKAPAAESEDSVSKSDEDDSDDSTGDDEYEEDKVEEKSKGEEVLQVKEVWVDTDYICPVTTDEKQTVSDERGEEENPVEISSEEKCEEEKPERTQPSLKKQEETNEKEKNEEEDSGVQGSVEYNTGEQEALVESNESSQPVETWT